MSDRCLSAHVLETFLSVTSDDHLQLWVQKQPSIDCLFASGDSRLMLLFMCQFLKHLLDSMEYGARCNQVSMIN